jgi:PKHD-type hydroxylase
MEGADTAGGVARSVKHNQHLRFSESQAGLLLQLVTGALGRHPLFFRAALPKLISQPAINRYASGMRYGFHYDLPLQYTAEGVRVRADLSATLFLSAPEDYDGGELQIAHDGEMRAFKEKAGDLVMYPSGALHRVNPVTRGERYAVIFWLQSMIRDPQHRSLLFACDELVERIAHKMPDSEEVRDLTGLFVNLGHLWLDT